MYLFSPIKAECFAITVKMVLSEGRERFGTGKNLFEECLHFGK